MMNNREKQSVARGFTSLGLAGIINKVLGVIYIPVLTLILGNAGNGIYNAGYTIYLLIFVITNAGIPIAISKLVSEQLASFDQRASFRTLKISAVLLVSLGVLMSVLTAVFAKNFSSIIGWPEAYLTILALSPTLFFTAVSCTFRGYFQGRSYMTPTSVSQIIEQAVNSTFTILFAWIMLNYGKNYAVAHGITGVKEIRLEAIKFAAAGGTVGTSVGAMVSAFYLWMTFRRKRKGIIREFRESVSTRESQYTTRTILRKIFKYAVPITVGSVLIYAANIIDLSFIKGRLIAGGFGVNEANALYGIFSTQYIKVIFIPVIISTALATAIIPAISAAHARKDKLLLNSTINKSLKTILMLTIPAAVGIAVLAKPIVNILFPTSPDGWDLLIIGSWILILISVVSIQTAILQGLGKTYVPTMHLVVGMALKIIINYSLVAVKAVNIKGAIAGSAVCYIFAGFMNYRSIKKYTGVRLKFRQIFNRPLSVSVIMGLIVYLTYRLLDFASGCLIKSVFLRSVLCGGLAIMTGGIVYYLIMIAAKGITAEDIKRFPMGNRILSYTTRVSLFRKLLIKM